MHCMYSSEIKHGQKGALESYLDIEWLLQSYFCRRFSAEALPLKEMISNVRAFRPMGKVRLEDIVLLIG